MANNLAGATQLPDVTNVRFDTATATLNHRELAERPSLPLQRLDYGVRSDRFAERPFEESCV
jgi:hypothetical protein